MAQTTTQTVERRSANYVPNIWKHEFITTLKNGYKGEEYVEKANVLKDNVRNALDHVHDEKGPLALLELINDIERLGLGYIFEQHMCGLLSHLKDNNIKLEGSLHATALYFRLFRQHGLKVSQDVFNVFKDPNGSFMEHLSNDINGILSLYEASYLSTEGEDVLDEAKTFARHLLTNVIVTNAVIDPNLCDLVTHALSLPLHFKFMRYEARWYIDVYSKRNDVDANLLELAKLDYNMVQACYQEELNSLSRWWKNLGLQKLDFARDRMVEGFLWSVGMIGEPQYKYCRESFTKLTAILAVIDDIYDVYSTLDEAKLFTEAFERWDVDAMEPLPEYMKITFFAIFNTVNELAYNTYKEQGFDVLKYLRKQWVDLIKGYMLEAEWFHTGYKPTFKEYMDNGCISSTALILNYHIYVFMTANITQEALEYLDSYPNIVHWPSLIFRLTDDLATYQAEAKRGDAPKAIECYMNDTGATEEGARHHIRYLVDDAWKKMNADFWVDSPLPHAMVKELLNSMRTAEVSYQYGDGYGIPDRETKGQVLAIIVDSIPM